MLPKHTPKNLHFDLLVGNKIAKIPEGQARLVRTGQKKVFDYTLYAKIKNGNPNAIRR